MMTLLQSSSLWQLCSDPYLLLREATEEFYDTAYQDDRTGETCLVGYIQGFEVVVSAHIIHTVFALPEASTPISLFLKMN